MRTKRWSLLVGMLLLLAGCGGGAHAPVREASLSPRSGARTASVHAVEGADALSPPEPSAPPSMEVEARSAPSSAAPSVMEPRERLGLGTEWGETRESRVRDVSFFRADPHRPFAITTLHYDDREGIDAMLRRKAGRVVFAREVSARGGAISVSIQGEGGVPLETLRVGDRAYVVGRAGERYSIVLTNHTPHRFEAVATVDGLDVVDGRPGSLDHRGYVLMPYARLEIDGFRQSQNHVAAFRFGRVADSYAAQTGSARNVGVIGVAFFAERGDFYDEEELRIRDSADPFPVSDRRFARPPAGR